MSSIERRLVNLKLGTSASPLFDFLREFAQDPYREFVQYRLRSFSTRQLQDAALNDWAVAADALGLPVELEVLARVGATLKARYLVGPGYWIGPSARTCAEAFADIISAVEDEIDRGLIRDKKVEEALEKIELLGHDFFFFRNAESGEYEELPEDHQCALLGLVMFATNLFAGLASESRFIRRHIGMRKGIFG